jgi:putative FmdB family regulatory protein
MPIYEFYCGDCHTVYSFFTSKIDLGRRPACPQCERPDLERKPSRFATLKHRGDAPDEDPFAGLDESRLEGAMNSLMGEMAHVNEEDPRAMGQFMRRFSKLTGLELGGRMEDLVARMEAGEDPEALEAEIEGEMGDGGEGESFEDFFKLKTALVERKRTPRVDDELYFF